MSDVSKLKYISFEAPITVEFKSYGNQTFKPGYFLSLGKWDT